MRNALKPFGFVMAAMFIVPTLSAHAVAIQSLHGGAPHKQAEIVLVMQISAIASMRMSACPTAIQVIHVRTFAGGARGKICRATGSSPFALTRARWVRAARQSSPSRVLRKDPAKREFRDQAAPVT